MQGNYQAWFENAQDNLKWAEDNFKDGNFPLVCFLSQQAVELLLKSCIYSKDKIPPKTHQLVRLAEFCKQLGFKLNELLPKLAILSEYYLESRYPDELNRELNQKGVAQKALGFAKEIFEAILPELC